MKDLKIVFAPGCFDNLDITQEELDKLVGEIQAAIADGSLFENSTPVDDEDLPPEVLEQMAAALDAIDNPEAYKRKLN